MLKKLTTNNLRPSNMNTEFTQGYRDSTGTSYSDPWVHQNPSLHGGRKQYYPIIKDEGCKAEFDYYRKIHENNIN